MGKPKRSHGGAFSYAEAVAGDGQGKWLMVTGAVLGTVSITYLSCRTCGFSPLLLIVLAGAAVAFFHGGGGGPPIRPA